MSKTKPVPRHRPAMLERILDTPNLALVVPRLQPDVLHRLIRHYGLEACSELVALATPEQLARVFDLDLWRSGQPGLDERFDAERFGVWLEVLVESDVKFAAEQLTKMDVDLVIAGLAEHVLVFDRAAIAPPVPMDGMDGEEEPTARAPDGLGSDVGGYRVAARRTDSWEAIVSVLAVLDAEHRDYFHRVMRGCRSLSNSGREVDGLDDLLGDPEQVMFDLTVDRERRREQQGYVTPAQARAFLTVSRQLRLGHGVAPPDNPLVRAYFRAIEQTTPADAPADSGSRRLPAAASGAPPSPEDSAAAVAADIDVILDASFLAPQPRALLDGPQGQAFRLARIQAHMQFAQDRDAGASAMRSQELAYLANTIVAGCSIQARAFTAQEASDAAVAVCNLGLENWPPRWLPATARRGSSGVDDGTALPDDFLVDHDLVSVFQVGWTVLHGEVAMYAAGQLIKVLAGLRSEDREIQAGLRALRVKLTKHWRAGAPWRARDALDVVASLDMPAWAALLGLIDECPVIHAALGASRASRVRAVSASAFEFISENRQIASVPAFMQSLPETLRG